MEYARYNDACVGCRAPGPIVRVPNALPMNDRAGFISRFYGKLQWLMTPLGPLCPTCKANPNVAS